MLFDNTCYFVTIKTYLNYFLKETKLLNQQSI